MGIMIIDSCLYTNIGISDFYSEKYGLNRKVITTPPSNVTCDLLKKFSPSLVVISDDAFYHHKNNCDVLKKIIQSNRSVFFVIFVSSFNIRYQELILLDDNVLICSKEINESTLDDLFSFNFFDTKAASNLCNFILSPTERVITKLWMSGKGTLQIGSALNICAKTVSTHKGNIKKKLKTNNMQTIFNIIRLSNILAPQILFDIKTAS